MTKLGQIYKCEVCGNIIEIIHKGNGELVCCGQPMVLQVEKKEDEGQEKHVPIIKKNNQEILIKVGNVPHPMETSHFIEWIEIITKSGKVYRKFLKPGDNPKTTFTINEEIILVREYCNIHGLWSNK